MPLVDVQLILINERFYLQGYFIKYLDQININNAFVSGMYASLSFRVKALFDRS